MAIRPENLAEEILDYLEMFTEEIIEELDKAAKAEANKAVKELKKTSPKRKTNGGTYAKGWRVKKDKKNGYIIHNKHYHLTHLLEKGHAKVGGGRVQGEKHIDPVERKVIKKYLKAVEEAINK